MSIKLKFLNKLDIITFKCILLKIHLKRGERKRAENGEKKMAKKKKNNNNNNNNKKRKICFVDFKEDKKCQKLASF